MKLKVFGNKICPSCQKSFECKVNSHLECQCLSIELTHEQKDYLKERFKDCLCADCLRKETVQKNLPQRH